MSLPGRSARKRGSGTAVAGRFWCDRGHTHLLQFTEMHFPAAPSKRLPPAASFCEGGVPNQGSEVHEVPIRM